MGVDRFFRLTITGTSLFFSPCSIVSLSCIILLPEMVLVTIIVRARYIEIPCRRRHFCVWKYLAINCCDDVSASSRLYVLETDLFQVAANLVGFLGNVLLSFSYHNMIVVYVERLTELSRRPTVSCYRSYRHEFVEFQEFESMTGAVNAFSTNPVLHSVHPVYHHF